jgi:[ribosomal protein S5]-alanine N-acetyltransferase
VTLDTERLRLRPFTLTDAPYVLAQLNQPSFLEQIGDRGVRSLEQAEAWVRSGPWPSYAAHGHGLLAVEERPGGEVIGMCGLLRREALPEPDLGYAFLPGAWGRGYATEAGRAVLDHARHVLGLARILAIVSPGNGASIRVLEKLGFRRDGSLRLPGEAADVARFAWSAPGRPATLPGP